MNLKYLILTGYFNTRCPRWWQNDIANSAGHEIDSLSYSRLDINKLLINLSMS